MCQFEVAKPIEPGGGVLLAEEADVQGSQSLVQLEAHRKAIVAGTPRGRGQKE